MEEKKNKENVDLADIFWSYAMHWRWIVFSLIVSVISGYFYYKLQPFVYQASASVLINSTDSKESYSESALLNELGVKAGANVENEVEVFRSKKLLYKVVEALNLNASYYYETALDRLHEIYKETPVIAEYDSLFLKELKNSYLQLLVTKLNDNTYSIKGTLDGVKFSSVDQKLPSTVHTPIGKLRLKLNPKSVTFERPVVIVFRSTKSIVSSMAIQSSVGKKTELISLSTTSQNGNKCLDILNLLIASYNQDAMAQMNRASLNTADFIKERIKFLSDELSSVEKDVESYKKKNEFNDISSEAQSYLSKSSEYETKLVGLQTQLRLVGFVEEFVKNEKNRFSPIPNVGIEDANLNNLLAKYNELLFNRSRYLESTTSDNPSFQAINNQILSLSKNVSIGIVNVKKALLIQQNDLMLSHKEAEGMLSKIPTQEREFIEIKRQQQIKEQLYIFLLQKREESALTMALTVPKAVVVNEAELSGLVSPIFNVIMMYAFVLGFFFPLVVIYLKNLFNTKIYSKKDIESRTFLPVISEMAHAESNNSYLFSEAGLDSTTELFRLLRTKINFVLEHPKEKIILVTSTEPGEGKTFISINLALSLSMADKKVLLVGLDLRKPQLADKFGIDQKEGLTSYLSQQEKNIEGLICTSSEFPNLSILHSGIVPPNPNELLMKESLTNLMADFRDKYDYVIMDSAPIGVVSDSLLLFKHADVTLYVCRSAFSSYKNLEIINQLVEEEPSYKVFIILNDLSQKHNYYKYKYNYNYGYGYSYGYGGRYNGNNQNKMSDRLKSKFFNRYKS